MSNKLTHLARYTLHYCRVDGQAMTEFIIIIPVLLLLILGAVQIGFIYSAKTTLNYATFQAARLAAVNNATYSSMRRGLIRGLAPLYTNTTNVSSIKNDIEQGISSSLGKRDANGEVDNYTRIIRLSPRASHFNPSGFGVQNDDGIYEIPNDNLMYRPPTLYREVSIQDANLLKIRVQYCYKLMVPLVNRVIGSLSELNNKRLIDTAVIPYDSNDPKFADGNQYYTDLAAGSELATYKQLCRDRADGSQGFIISADAIIRMQSPAFEEEIDDPDAGEDYAGDRMCDGVKMTCP